MLTEGEMDLCYVGEMANGGGVSVVGYFFPLSMALSFWPYALLLSCDMLMGLRSKGCFYCCWLMDLGSKMGFESVLGYLAEVGQ